MAGGLGGYSDCGPLAVHRFFKKALWYTSPGIFLKLPFLRSSKKERGNAGSSGSRAFHREGGPSCASGGVRRSVVVEPPLAITGRRVGGEKWALLWISKCPSQGPCLGGSGLSPWPLDNFLTFDTALPDTISPVRPERTLVQCTFSLLIVR